MLDFLLIISLLGGASSKPLSSCGSQSECLNVDVTPTVTTTKGLQQYEICLSWDASSLPECRKSSKDSISHACPLGGEKIENWKEGVDNAICATVTCGDTAIIALKDGKECIDSAVLADFGVPGYNEYVKCYDGEGGDCAEKNSKACQWLIPAPECEVTTTTTTSTTSTTTTTTTTTTLPPGVTVVTEATPTTTTTTEAEALPTTTTPSEAPTCECGSFSELPVSTKISSCLSLPECVLLGLEGECFCHECDCADINSLVMNNFEEAASNEERCNPCVLCHFDSAEGCIDATNINNIVNVYTRDPDTLMNTNNEFVAAEDVEGIFIPTGGIKKFVNENPLRFALIIVGSIVGCFVIVMICCCFWRERERKKWIKRKDMSSEEEETDKDGATFTA